MDRSRLIEAVRERSGLSAEGAERAIVATLGVLAERLLEIDAHALASRLPPAWARVFARGGDREFDLDGFYDRVSEREGVGRVQALEHAQVVCQVLAGSLDEIGRQHLVLHLPEAWRQLFAPRPVGAPEHELHGASRRHVPAGAGRTLATGRPGAHRPLSEASPAHSGSIAASEDPHGDTKLSSSRGISVEREGDTLADGKPGSKHPLSEASD